MATKLMLAVAFLGLSLANAALNKPLYQPLDGFGHEVVPASKLAADLLEKAQQELGPLLKMMHEEATELKAAEEDVLVEKSHPEEKKTQAPVVEVLDEALGPGEELPGMLAWIGGKASAVPTGRGQQEEDKIGRFEKSVSDLVIGLGKMKVKGGAAATPMGTSVESIKDMIEKTMMPKVQKAHKFDQTALDTLVAQAKKCDTTRANQMLIAQKQEQTYKSKSPEHKNCRVTEAALSSQLGACSAELKNRKTLRDLTCSEFAATKKRLGSQSSNIQIVTKGAQEPIEMYIRRLTSTVAGKGCDGNGGSGKGGFLDLFLNGKDKCKAAEKAYTDKSNECKLLNTQYTDKKNACNNVQDMMDNAACSWAIQTKDACEGYADCFLTKGRAYALAENQTKKDEVDRKAEWRSLKRMQCLIVSFSDGKVEDGEVKLCKDKTHNTDHLNIKYPGYPDMKACSVPSTYPTTAVYKKKEFVPLPALAKGRPDQNECTGVLEISTTPRTGSPTTCKCERVTLNGPYSAGPIVKCTNCMDVYRSGQANSCPDGTKLFSPRSRADWATFIASATALRAPNWIVDVTQPKNGCGGCTKNTMSSDVTAQSMWKTSDGSPWWLRSAKYNEPNGDYHANCYLDLWRTPLTSDTVTFNDHNCNYHSKSYFCQRKVYSTAPKKGSPPGCTCKRVELVGKYSAGMLIKCEQCLTVRRTTEMNSCPVGTKIFSPATRDDWKTFINSASPLRNPHWIVDVTRPQNGCGGCTRFPMNFGVAEQKTWRTADGTPWWLRDTRYGEPNGDYHANCYLDLWHNPVNENSVTFNDGSCGYHSRSYYCQPAKLAR